MMYGTKTTEVPLYFCPDQDLVLKVIAEKVPINTLQIK